MKNECPNPMCKYGPDQNCMNPIHKENKNMSEFKKYCRTNIAEMRRFTPGEELNKNVSISTADLDNGSPKAGDMIARNPKNHDDQWLVAKDYFENNFEILK